MKKEVHSAKKGLIPKQVKTEVGPELILLTDGLQPFMFRANNKTIVLQAQMSYPPGSYQTDKDPYPGLPGTVVSRDNGKSWARWYPPADLVLAPRCWMPNPVGDIGPIFEGTAVQLRKGPILIVNYAGDGPNVHGKWWGRLWESDDGFKTVKPLSMLIELPDARNDIGDSGHGYGIRFHRTLMELPNGDLLLTAYCVFAGDCVPMPYLPNCSKCRSILLKSKDRGNNWEYVSTMAYDPTLTEEGFDEPVLARVSKGKRAGRLVCIMRTGSWETHPLYQVVSDDGGLTWTKPAPLPFSGVSPDLIEMSDGTLVCCFGLRMKLNPDCTVPKEHAYYLSFSHDQGDSWSELTRLDIDAHTYIRYGTAYSAILEIEPGTLFVAYDVGSWGWPVRYIASRIVRVRK